MRDQNIINRSDHQEIKHVFHELKRIISKNSDAGREFVYTPAWDAPEFPDIPGIPEQFIFIANGKFEHVPVGECVTEIYAKEVLKFEVVDKTIHRFRIPAKQKINFSPGVTEVLQPFSYLEFNIIQGYYMQDGKEELGFAFERIN